jgi:hypothetical protein
LPDSGSPDLADALALTFAQPVSSFDEYHGLPVKRGRSKEYNPYELVR